MFGIPLPLLIENLELLRKQLCAYGPDAKRCDCKYRNLEAASSFRTMGRGEVTGCPELRLAIKRLQNFVE